MLQFLKRVAARFAGVSLHPEPTINLRGGTRGRPRKLTAADVRAIRELYGAPAPNGRAYSIRMLARIFRVSSATIGDVVQRRGSYARDAA